MEKSAQVQTSAKEIFLKGYDNLRASKSLDAKTFFMCLRDTVITEYKKQGFCELIDEIIENKETVDIIVYVAFVDAVHYLKSGLFSDESEQYIPHLLFPGYGKPGRRIAWKEWSVYKRQFKDGYKYEKAAEIFYSLKKSGQKSHLLFLKDIGDSKEEADRQAKSIIDEAQQTGLKIIEDARLEAEKSKSVLNLVGSNNEKVLAQKRSEELIRKYLTNDRIEFKKSIEKDLNDTLKGNKEVLCRTEKMHDDMCDQTNALQASWANALTSMTDELVKIKEEFYKHLHDWQVSLYPHELRPLAERYVELYRIINVDRLLTEEIVFNYSQNEHIDENFDVLSKKKDVGLDSEFNIFGADKCKDTETVKKEAPDEGKYNVRNHSISTAPSTLEGLKKLNRTLTIFLHKFEVSLNGLDMYVFYPDKGDVFDDVWHVLENEDCYNDWGNNIISYCVVPGIAKKVNDAAEDDVIIPAIVAI